MIYFLQPVNGGAIKIGHTSDLAARQRALESDYGSPLALLATLPGGRKEEAELHARFSHLRFGRTEQFAPAPDLMNFIGRPLLISPNHDTVEAHALERVTIASLKGSVEQGEWLDYANRATHISKSVILRLALADWAVKMKLNAFPVYEDER